MDWIRWGLQVSTTIALFIVFLGVPLYLVWTGGWYGILGLVLYAVAKAVSLVYFTESK